MNISLTYIFMLVMNFVYLVGEALFRGSENSPSVSENRANPQTEWPEILLDAVWLMWPQTTFLCLLSAGCPKYPFLLMIYCFCLIQCSPLAMEMASLSRRQQNGQQTGLSHVIFLKYFPSNEMTSFEMLLSAQGKYFFIKQKWIPPASIRPTAYSMLLEKLLLQNNLMPEIFPILPFSITLHFSMEVQIPTVPVTNICRTLISLYHIPHPNNITILSLRIRPN